MTTSIIEMNGVSKVYYTTDIETWALKDIDLFVEQGEYVALSGPSGCGKSTLLSVIGLLNSSSSGEYVLNDSNVTSLSDTEMSLIRNLQIGFIFQAFNLVGEMSVFENVELPLTYRTDMSKSQRRQRVAEVLKKVSMDHRSKHYPNQLSGGQQQRVAIARALAGGPKLILADEPTGNLDSKNADDVKQLLRDLNQEGCTICMVTHDPEFAKQAGRIVHMLDGSIVGSPDVDASSRTI